MDGKRKREEKLTATILRGSLIENKGTRTDERQSNGLVKENSGDTNDDAMRRENHKNEPNKWTATVGKGKENKTRRRDGEAIIKPTDGRWCDTISSKRTSLIPP